MNRLLFGIIAILAIGIGAANAEHIELKPGEPLHLSQGCFDAHGQARDPVAVADGSGVAHLSSGQVIRGYPPYAEICGNFPLKDAAVFKWDRLRLAEYRDPKYCKRHFIPGRKCRHLVRDTDN